MRILVVSNLYPPDVVGGYEIGCSHVVGELRRRGHDTVVLTSTSHLPIEGGGDERRALRFEDVGDPYLFAHRDARGHRLAMVRAMMVDGHNVSVLRAAVEDHDPELVYLWNTVGVGGLALALAADLRGLPWVWHLMDAGPRDLAAAAQGAQAGVARMMAARLRGSWISCSRRLLDEITAMGGPLDDRVEAIPNWVRGDPPAPRDDWWRAGRPLRCVTAGRLVAEKGVDIAIEAVQALAAQGHDVRLDVYGAGPDLPRLQALAGRSAGADVRFCGAVAQVELVERFEDHDLFLFPTWEREPFAFAPLEAAARGCVPVVTAGTGNAEWFVDGEHLLTADRTAEAFGRVLGEVLSGAVDLPRMAAAGKEVVWRRFHLGRAVDRIETVLTETAAGAAPSSPVPWADIERMALLADRLAQVIVART